MIENPELYRVRVEISKTDRDFILKKTLSIQKTLREAFRAGIFEDNRLVFKPTLAELRGIVDSLFMECRYAESRSVRRRFERIYEKLDDYRQSVEREIRMRIASGFDEGREALHEEIREHLARTGATTVEEANRELKRFQDEYNRRPKKEFGGLSPLQMTRILGKQHWEDPSCALWVNPNLSEADVCGARMMINARMFLGALEEEGGTRATDKGNLNRRFVERIFNNFTWRPGYNLDLKRKMTKQYNEQEFWDIHVLRVVLELAKCIRKYKKRFVVTKRGAEAFDPERAGAFFAHLFITYFRKLNLDYTTPWEDIPEIQDTVAYSFYHIGRLANDWISHLDLIKQVTMPDIKGALYNEYHESIDYGPACVRLLRPLEVFGLLEERDGRGYWFFSDEPTYLRKTSLFDKLLHFNV